MISGRIFGRISKDIRLGRCLSSRASLQDRKTLKRLPFHRVSEAEIPFESSWLCTTALRYNSQDATAKTIEPLEYEKLSDETLEELSEYLENCFQTVDNDELDAELSNGVLTIKLGKNHGTYVINKQTPNKQIWLSSPTSGPKRYDFIKGQWIYSHDGSNLHDLLQVELTKALDYEFNMKDLVHYDYKG